MGRDVRTWESGVCLRPKPTHSPPSMSEKRTRHRARKRRVAPECRMAAIGPPTAGSSLPSPALPHLTATPGLLLQQSPQNPTLQRTQLPQPA